MQVCFFAHAFGCLHGQGVEHGQYQLFVGRLRQDVGGQFFMDGAVVEGGEHFGYFGKQLLRFSFEFGTFFLAHQCQHFLEVFAVEEGVEVVVSHIFFHLRPSEKR